MSGLYIHIPFCRSKCAYCDFYSTTGRDDAEAYVDTLLLEFDLRAAELCDDISTIYIGGGTPTVLSDDTLRRLVSGLSSRIDFSKVVEFTIEANPEDVTGSRLDELRSMGINRVSIGIQSFDGGKLRVLNRNHDPASAEAALDLLSASGINYSADLIFGLPGQSSKDWEREFTRLLSYHPPHFSAYLLSYEPGTRLYARLIAGKVSETDESLADDMYKKLARYAADNGYRHYEISNYALPEMHALHNSSYWDLTPYLGLGVSAHSFDGVVRRYNPIKIREYIEMIGSGRKYCVTEEETIENRFNDMLITALRTDTGLSLKKVELLFGKEYAKGLGRAAGRFLEDGKLRKRDFPDGMHLVIPEEHWLTADAILRELIV